jgi:phosphate/sulfate permease
LAHDVANVAVFLPRGEALPLWMFVSFLAILVAGLAHLFYNRGGKIQEIVLSKSGTRFMRSATIIDFSYALVLWYFKQYNNIPMSTTWVFVGLLCGRELAVYRHFNSKKGIKMIFPMLVADFIKMMVGLALSVLLVWIIS